MGMINKVDLGKVISILGTILLCAGLLSQTTYYFFFNVHITDFLSISEILLLFTGDVIRYIIVFIVITVIAILMNTGEPSLSHKRFFIKYCKTELITKRFTIYLKSRFFTIVYYAFAIIILASLIKESSNQIYLFLLCFFIELVYLALRFYVWESKRKLRIKGTLLKENEPTEMYITMTLHFLFFVVSWAIVDVQKVKYQEKYKNVSFEMNDRVIKSDSLNFYIGQTEKFLFYYNLKKNETTVYKMEDIKSMSFGEIIYFKIEDFAEVKMGVKKPSPIKRDSIVKSLKIDTLSDSLTGARQ